MQILILKIDEIFLAAKERDVVLDQKRCGVSGMSDTEDWPSEQQLLTTRNMIDREYHTSLELNVFRRSLAWARAVRYFNLDSDQTRSSDKILIPGMKRSIYHWQWHAVFLAVLTQHGVNGQLGGIIGDEMGLEKVKLTIPSLHETRRTNLYCR